MSTVKQDVFTESGEYKIYQPKYTTGVESNTPNYPYPADRPWESSDYQDRQAIDETQEPWSIRDRSNTSIGYPGDDKYQVMLPPGFGSNASTGYAGKRLETPTLTLHIGNYAPDYKTTKHGLGTDKCKVDITGSYMMGVHMAPINNFSGVYNGQPALGTAVYSYKNASGTVVSPSNVVESNSTAVTGKVSGTVSDFDAPFQATPVPFDILNTQPSQQAGLQLNLRQYGGSVTGGAINETNNLELKIQLKNTSQRVPGTATAANPQGESSKRSYFYLVPYTENAPYSYAYFTQTWSGFSVLMTNYIWFKGTYTRSWEGNLHTIDGVGGDTIPTMSMVATTQFAGDRNLVVEPINLSSSFSLQESSVSVVNAGTISLSAQFTTAVVGAVKTDTAKDLQSQFIFIGSPYNLVLIEPQSYDMVFSTSFVGNKVHKITQSLQSESAVSVNAGMIYDLIFFYTWNSFNLNTFFAQGYVIGGYVQQEEYTWDDLTTDSWHDWTFEIWEGSEESWDGWPFDLWERTFDLPMVATSTQTGQAIRGAVSNFLSQFFITENSAKNEAGEASLSASFSVLAQPSGIMESGSTMESSTSTATQDNAKFDSVIAISSALSFSINANLKTDITDTESSEFAVSIIPTVKRGITIVLETTASTTAFAGIVRGAQAQLTSAMTFLVEARMVTQADPYFTIKVPQEIRTHVLAADSRVLLVCQENRVNTPVHESRVLLVDQETRIHYLMIPPLTNIKSTPYERAI